MTTESLFPTDDELARLLVGPESVAWRFGSDARLFLAPLYPLILQVAHPTVGAGVRDYSDFDSRPWDRLLRTLDYVSLLIYGGEEAVAAGRRLRALHKGFQGVREDGERYYALEPKAYAWVHATLIDAYVTGHRHYGRPMRRDQVERFYAEYRGLGRLVGVRERDLPPDWRGFREYFDITIAEELTRTVTVDRVLHSVKHAAPPPLPVPIPRSAWRALRMPPLRALWVGGLALLPPALRDRLGIEWTHRDERQFRMLAATSRRLTPVMPRRLLISGPDQLRMRRRAIERGSLGPGADQRRATVASRRGFRAA
jgi:uncharacterized protein (DUF2236 family)